MYSASQILCGQFHKKISAHSREKQWRKKSFGFSKRSHRFSWPLNETIKSNSDDFFSWQAPKPLKGEVQYEMNPKMASRQVYSSWGPMMETPISGWGQKTSISTVVLASFWSVIPNWFLQVRVLQIVQVILHSRDRKFLSGFVWIVWGFETSRFEFRGNHCSVLFCFHNFTTPAQEKASQLPSLDNDFSKESDVSVPTRSSILKGAHSGKTGSCKMDSWPGQNIWAFLKQFFFG